MIPPNENVKSLGFVIVELESSRLTRVVTVPKPPLIVVRG